MILCRSLWRPAVPLLLPVPGIRDPPPVTQQPKVPGPGADSELPLSSLSLQHSPLCNPTKSPVMGAAGSGDQEHPTSRNAPGTPSPPFRAFCSPFPPFSHLFHQNLTGETEAQGLRGTDLLGGCWKTTGKTQSCSEGEVLELVQQHATVPGETQWEAKPHRGILSVILRNQGDFPEQLWRRNNLCKMKTWLWSPRKGKQSWECCCLFSN